MRYIIKTAVFLVILIFSVSCQAFTQQYVTESSDSAETLQQLPYDRILQPAGKQIFFGDPALENHALDASLSPDGSWLAVEERFSIVFINTLTNEIIATLPLKQNPDLKGTMNTYSGIIWQQKGDKLFIWWSCAGNGKSFVAKAIWNGAVASFAQLFSYADQPPASLALPNELLISKEDGRDYLYVVLNGNNQVIKQDAETGDTVWTVTTGVAPYGITRAGGKLYVTNWGGRIPAAKEKNTAGVPWGNARVDPNTGATSEGSVTVLNPESGKIIKQIQTGLHPNEIAKSADGAYVYVTNSNSDNVMAISTALDAVTETISVRLHPEVNSYFGDSPNGLAVSPDGNAIYVTNGMDNAIAVISPGRLAATRGAEDKSSVEGFIPTGAYPSSVSVSADGNLYITNLEGRGAQLPVPAPSTEGLAFNAHHMLASVSIIDIPDKKQLEKYTNTVVAVNQMKRLTETQLPLRN